LWNRNIADQPKLPSKEEFPLADRFKEDGHRLARSFLLICICQHLVRKINPNSTWGERVLALLKTEFPDLKHLGLTLQGMGVVDEWRELNWTNEPYQSVLKRRFSKLEPHQK